MASILHILRSYEEGSSFRTGVKELFIKVIVNIVGDLCERKEVKTMTFILTILTVISQHGNAYMCMRGW